MADIISYSIKFGNVAIECFTSQTYGGETEAFEKAKAWMDAYLIKQPNAAIRMVRSVKKDKVKWL